MRGRALGLHEAGLGMGRRMKFCVLGPVAVYDGDTRLDVGAPKQRLVLALLLREPNRVVSVDRLVEDVWGDQAPATATATLQVYISQLRRAMHPDRRAVLVTQAPGYLLRADPDSFDAICFEDLLHRAQSEMSAGRPDLTDELIGQALSLWRGEPYADLADEPALRPDIERLRELRALAAETRIRAWLEVGRHGEAIAQLETFVSSQPLREGWWELLMLARYRAGRPAESLRAFQDAGRVLAEEVGLQPGATLVDLERRIVAQDPSLLRPVGPVGDTPVRPPLPSRLAVAAESPLVGRDGVLAGLDELRMAARNGRRRVVLVGGEPGVGKTRLGTDVCLDEFDSGALVLYGRCDPELAVPYLPWLEALGHLVTHISDDVLSSVGARHLGVLSQLLPELVDRGYNDATVSRSSDHQTERYALFQAVTSLITRTASAAPVVLFVDDLHWADEPTLRLLRHLIDRTPTTPLLVIASYRDSEVGKGSALANTLAELRRQPGVERVSLTGLDHDAVVVLMEARIGRPLGDASFSLADAIQRETDGNPFFVGEVLSHLLDSGGFDVDGVPLPESVREVIGHRVSRLGDHAAKILAAASVVGQEFDVDLLARVVDESNDVVFAALELAASASLVRPVDDAGDRLSFVHALVQHTLEEGLGSWTRRRLHRRVGEVLEDVAGDDPGDRIGQLATHWLAAAPTDPKAVRYARLAGERALAGVAPDAAVRWFTAAIEVADQLAEVDEQQQCRLLVGLGTAQRDLGNPDFRRSLLDAAKLAQSIGDTEQIVAAALASNRGIFSSMGVVDTDKVSLINTALAAIGDGDTAERALLLASLCNELTYGSPFPDRQSLARQAKAMADRVGDPATIIQVITLTKLPVAVPHNLDERVAETAQAVLLAEQLGDPYLSYWANSYAVQPAYQACRIEEGDGYLAAAATLAEHLGATPLWTSHGRMAYRASLSGDTAEAERLADRMLQIGTDSGQPDAQALYRVQLISVRWQQGRIGELIPAIRQAVADAPNAGRFTALLALAHSDVDLDDEAAALLQQATAERFASVRLDHAWLTAMVCYAEAAIHLTAQGPAAALMEVLGPWCDQMCGNGLSFEGPVAHYLGGLAAVLDRQDEAAMWFAKSAALCEKEKVKFFGARTDLEWGRMLLTASRSGDRREAARHLESSRHSAAANGYATVERRATAALGGAR